MKIIKENSPHIRKGSSVKRMMIDVIIALMPVVIFAFIQYGLNALKLFGISIVTMLAAEFIFCFITLQDPYDGTKHNFKNRLKTCTSKMTINNITAPLISALIYALIMPAGATWYVIFVGALFGIVIGKLVFGGLGGNIFNPAAVGRVFAMVAFGALFKYTMPSAIFNVDIFAGGTPLASEVLSNSSIFTWEALRDLFFGLTKGSMGEVCKALIIVGGIYLFIRRSADFRPAASMILSFMLIMLIAGFMMKSVNPWIYMLYHTLSGGLLFGAIFMITDPVTSPTTAPGRVTFGLMVGIISAFIRLFGAYPEGVAFAILIANMFVPVIDYYKFSSNKYSFKKILLWLAMIVLAIIVIVVAL